jgi:predicted transcriptional regulator
MDNQQESLATIPGFRYYSASKTGRIYSHLTQKYLKPVPDKWGYYRVTVKDDNGKWSKKTIHRLVAFAFLPNPEGFPVVHHIDDCKTNNCLDNLEWCTYSHNNRMDFVLKGEGRKVRRMKGINQFAETRERIKDRVLELKAQELSNVRIGKLVGVSGVTVGKVVQESSSTREKLNKLEDKEVIEIFLDDGTQSGIAEKYSVSQNTVSCIKRGKLYHKLLKSKGLVS